MSKQTSKSSGLVNSFGSWIIPSTLGVTNTVEGTILDNGTASCAAIVSRYSYFTLLSFNNFSIFEFIF
jgi:hypothetical protein